MKTRDHMPDGALFDPTTIKELNALHVARNAVYRQMMQARASQLSLGGLADLPPATIDFLRRDVLGRLAEYDLHVDNTKGDLLPGSPFEALMIHWLAVDADICEIEGLDIDTRRWPSSIDVR